MSEPKRDEPYKVHEPREVLYRMKWKVYQRSEEKALTLVRSAEKHHGIAAWKRIKTEYQPSNAHGNHATWLGFSRCGEHVSGPLD